jgi:hypothetical protein
VCIKMRTFVTRKSMPLPPTPAKGSCSGARDIDLRVTFYTYKENTMPDNMGMNTNQEGDKIKSPLGSYTFRVARPSAIDLDRVVFENKDADVILVHAIATSAFDPILYLSSRFLRAFDGTGPSVSGQPLSPRWGLPAFDNPRVPEYATWRCTFPGNTKVLRQEIKAARAYKNAITVTVEVL